MKSSRLNLKFYANQYYSYLLCCEPHIQLNFDCIYTVQSHYYGERKKKDVYCSCTGLWVLKTCTDFNEPTEIDSENVFDGSPAGPSGDTNEVFQTYEPFEGDIEVFSENDSDADDENDTT